MAIMHAEIVSIGSELTNGFNLDTNSQWLSLRLGEQGIGIGWHTTIADDLEANVAAFRIASERADLVLLSGGLGPTQDDLTREALARAAGVELIFHEPSFAHIQGLFARRGRTMPDRNKVQAFLPKGAEPLDNPDGTAPGIWMRLGRAWVAAMPGVPSEMKRMFLEQVAPRLQTLGMNRGVRLQRKISTFGAGESHIEEKLFDLTRRGQVPEVGITASDAIISLRIFAQAPTVAEARAQAAPIEALIRERLGSLVFGVDDQTLQDVVVDLLESRHLSLATAESVTGGLVAKLLTDVPGASRFVRGGIVAYDSRLKVALLGVPQDLIDRHGVISTEVVQAMAQGARIRCGTDLAVATVGLAGPTQGESERPVGQVHAALAWEGGAKTTSFLWGGTREEIRSRTAKMALNLVRLHLEQTAAVS